MARNRIERHIYHAVKRSVALGNRRSAVAKEYGISVESVRKISLSPNWKTWIQPKLRPTPILDQDQQLAVGLRLNEQYVSRAEFEASVKDLHDRLDTQRLLILKKKDKRQWPWGNR